MGYIGSYVWKLRKIGWGQERLLVPGVRAVLMNEKGQVLLAKRTDMEMWHYIGGSAEVGDSAEQTMRKEVEEEVGVTPEEFRPFAVTTRFDSNHMDYPNGDKLHFWDVYYLVTKWKGEAKVSDEENSHIVWFSMDSLPEDMSPLTAATMKILKNHLKTNEFIVD